MGLRAALCLAAGVVGGPQANETPQAPPPGAVVARAPDLTVRVSLRGRPDPACPSAAGQFEAARADRDAGWIAAQAKVGWTETEIARVVRAAAADAATQLVPVGARICVQLAAEPRAPILARMRGIGGAASPAVGVVSLVVAPSLGTPRWRDDLAFTVAHEYHHMAARRSGATGLDVLVREGLAHHFAWTRHPDRLHPSAEALAAGGVEAAAWQTIRAHLDIAGGEFTSRFMFGGAYFGDEVPTWAGYTIGFRMVRSFAERWRALTPRDLMSLPSHEVLAGSRFARQPAAPQESGGRRSVRTRVSTRPARPGAPGRGLH